VAHHAGRFVHRVALLGAMVVGVGLHVRDAAAQTAGFV
jgi:hypothetical protein